MDTQDLVRVYAARNEFQAEIIRNGLEAEGIPCQLENPYQGGMSVVIEVSLWVHASDAQRARAIIEEHEERLANMEGTADEAGADDESGADDEDAPLAEDDPTEP